MNRRPFCTGVADVYRAKVEQLAAVLAHDQEHDSARQALRSFIDRS
jgi:hypothetical protein